jgi:hypothetical protein
MKLTYSEIFSILGEYICAHQKDLAEYTFLTNEKHKAVKSAIADGDRKLASDLFGDLQDYSYKQFRKIFDSHVDYLWKLFEDRSVNKIRVCIKVIVREKTIATLYRKPESERGDMPFILSENTAFYEILNDGIKSYLCNDIPAAVEKDEYINNRIDRTKVLEYLEKKFLSTEEEERGWRECWIGKEIEATECYKSTLVVPMSLRTENLSTDFKEHLKIVPEATRAIFGFLCLDNIQRNFFEEENDINIAYIFADMLSLYLIHQLNLTEYSSDMKTL